MKDECERGGYVDLAEAIFTTVEKGLRADRVCLACAAKCLLYSYVNAAAQTDVVTLEDAVGALRLAWGQREATLEKRGAVNASGGSA